MKFVVRILALFILSVFVLQVAVTAAGIPTFSVSNKTVTAGSKAVITISIKNNPGITSAKLNVEFDGDLTLESVAFSSNLGTMTQHSEPLTSPVTINWFNGLTDFKNDTEFATLTFTVSKSAANGGHDIIVTYDKNDVFNVDEKNIDFAVANGIVMVSGGQDAPSSSSKVSSLADSSLASVSPEDEISKDTKTEETQEVSDGEVLTIGATDAEQAETMTQDGVIKASGSVKTILIVSIAAGVVIIGAAALLLLKKKKQ